MVHRSISSSAAPVDLRGPSDSGSYTLPQMQKSTTHVAYPPKGITAPVMSVSPDMPHQCCSPSHLVSSPLHRGSSPALCSSTPVQQIQSGLHTSILTVMKTPHWQPLATTSSLSPVWASQAVMCRQLQNVSRRNTAVASSVTQVTSGDTTCLPVQVISSQVETPANFTTTCVPRCHASSHTLNDDDEDYDAEWNNHLRIRVSVPSDSVSETLALLTDSGSISSVAGSTQLHSASSDSTARMSVQHTACIAARVNTQRQLASSIPSSAESHLHLSSAPSTSPSPLNPTPLPALYDHTSAVTRSSSPSPSLSPSTTTLTTHVVDTALRHQKSVPSVLTTLTSCAQERSTAPMAVSQVDCRSINTSQQNGHDQSGAAMLMQPFILQTQASGATQSAKIIRPETNGLAQFSSQASSNVRLSAGTVFGQLRQQQKPLHTSHTTLIGTKAAAEILSRMNTGSSVYTLAASTPLQLSKHASNDSPSSKESSSAVPVTNASSSPRPSILRKRPSEMMGSVIRKPIFNLNQDSSCPNPLTMNNTTAVAAAAATICSLQISASQLSLDKSTPSDGPATLITHSHYSKLKADVHQCLENGLSSSFSKPNNISFPAASSLEASPRKRARKQSLHVSEELKDDVSSTDDDYSDNHRDSSVTDQTSVDRKLSEYTEKDELDLTFRKAQSSYILLQPNVIRNTSRNNHFIRYSDLTVKEERWPSVSELSNQRGIMQKINGWKLYFSACQLEELMEVEKEMQAQFAEVVAMFAEIPACQVNCSDSQKVQEVSQANIQQCQLLQSQLTDSLVALIRMLDHKPRIQEIVSRHLSKRLVRRKEIT